MKQVIFKFALKWVTRWTAISRVRTVTCRAYTVTLHSLLPQYRAYLAYRPIHNMGTVQGSRAWSN